MPYTDGTFRPYGTITKAEFSKILAVLMDVESENLAFADTKGHWAESKINGLVDAGVIVTSEFPNGFGKGEPITRLEMSKMIARGLAKEKLIWKTVLTGFKQLEAIKLPFADKNEMSAADMPYIALANSSGIVNGYNDGTFGMDRSANRAEATVMLKRYLDAKNKKPLLSEILEKFKGKKTVHDLPKGEMEAWIDKGADLKRLTVYPVQHDFFDGLEEVNAATRGLPNRDKTSIILESRFNPTLSYMASYFNRDYTTIGDAWIKDLRPNFKVSQSYNGVNYYAPEGELPKFFDVLVQETKDEKRISESIFVSDISMVFSEQINKRVKNYVRGTQYIRYTSGTNLPEGIGLNKWYKRDLDVEIYSPSSGPYITWDVWGFVFRGIKEITSYEEVKE
jgi:hypothetical protein